MVRKSLTALAIAAFFALTGCKEQGSSQDQAQAPARTPPPAQGDAGVVDDGQPGIETSKKSWYTGNHAFITKARSGKYRAEFRTAGGTLGSPDWLDTTKRMQNATGAYVVLNGGFFEPDGNPSGLYVQNGRLLSKMKPGKGDGVLYVDKAGQVNIVHADALKGYSDQIDDAVQLTLLTYSGEQLYSTSYGEKKIPLHFVCLNDEGLVSVIFKNTNIRYGDEFMRGEYKCHSVAALDGGPSASAHDKFGKTSKEEKDEPEARVANFLVLYEK